MKIVKRLIKEGVDKKEIFAKASDEGLNPKKVSRLLAMYPDVEESEKYNKANNILIGIYIVMVLFGILGAASMLNELPTEAILGILAFALLIPIAVIYILYKKQALGYLVLSFFLIKGITDSIKEYQTDPVAVWIGVGLSACLIVYAVILKIKLFPHQNFFNTKKDSDGIVIFTKDVTSQASETPQSDAPS
ncbi:MAG: hypothetical protein ABUK01_08165 [Leptospirales bacterium]